MGHGRLKGAGIGLTAADKAYFPSARPFPSGCSAWKKSNALSIYGPRRWETTSVWAIGWSACQKISHDLLFTFCQMHDSLLSLAIRYLDSIRFWLKCQCVSLIFVVDSCYLIIINIYSYFRHRHITPCHFSDTSDVYSKILHIISEFCKCPSLKNTDRYTT